MASDAWTDWNKVVGDLGDKTIPEIDRSLNKILRRLAILNSGRPPAVPGPGASEGLTLEEMMSKSLGPITKEGYWSGSHSFAPHNPRHRTHDIAKIPSPDFLLPPLKPGQNTFGLTPRGRQNNRIPLDKEFESLTRGPYEPGKLRQLDAFLDKRMADRVAKLSDKEVLHELMRRNYSPKELDDMRKEAIEEKKDGLRGGTPMESIRGILKQTYIHDLIGAVFEGESI